MYSYANTDTGLRLPGVPLPFYREYANEYPPEHEVTIEGQNYGEHQLFALRTRVEADPTYAAYAATANTNIAFQRVSSAKGMIVCLCVQYIDMDGRVSTIVPDWLPEIVEKCLRKFPDYFMLVTDRYPLGTTVELPSAWLREMLCKINIRTILREALYPDDLTIEQKESRNMKPYTYFYHDGALYVKLIDEKNPRNRGNYTPTSPLKSGEPAFRRVAETYGDYEDYSTRYYSLQLKLTELLTDWYLNGTLVLDPVTDNSFIDRWKMVPIQGQQGIYTASWKDARFTFADGMTRMLERQHISYKNMWDYQVVYFNLTDNPAVLHNVVQVITKTDEQRPIVVNDLLLMRLDSYNDCVSYADAISEIIEVSQGIVQKTLTEVNGSVAYYDAIDHRTVYIQRVPDEVSFVVYSPRSKVRISKRSPITSPIPSPITSPTFDLTFDPRLIGSPLAVQ